MYISHNSVKTLLLAAEFLKSKRELPGGKSVKAFNNPEFEYMQLQVITMLLQCLSRTFG